MTETSLKPNGYIMKIFPAKKFLFVLKHPLSRLFVVCVLFASVPAVFGQPERKAAPAATYLEIGQTVEAEVVDRQRRVYKIRLPAGQYARLTVEQRGVDVTAVLAKDGVVLARYEANPTGTGSEEIFLTSAAAGEYEISVTPKQKFSQTGGYTIGFSEARPATEEEIDLDGVHRALWKAEDLLAKAEYEQALETAKTGLDTLNNKLDKARPAYVSALYSLIGSAYRDRGDYKRAEEYYLMAIETAEKNFGKDHYEVSNYSNNLGTLYRRRGEFIKAEDYLKRALAIREKILEPDHLEIAGVLMNLGVVYASRGNRDRAAGMFRKVLEIREKAFGPEHPSVAAVLLNIAALYVNSARAKTEAEPLLLRALSIYEKRYGPDHPASAQALYNLTIIYYQNNELDRAKTSIGRVLEIYQKRYGEEHPRTSEAMMFAALLHQIYGEYDRAEPLYERSVAIKEKTLGKYHPKLAHNLSTLALFYAYKGNLDKTAETLARANGIFEYNIRLNLSIGSERDRIKYIRSLAESERRTISFVFQADPDSPPATRLAAEMILQRKGRVFDAMAENLRSLRERLSEQDRKVLDDLSKITKELVDLVLAGPRTASPEEHQQKIERLEREREDLENRISRLSAGFYTKTEPVSLEAVRALLPEKTALLEFAIYRPLEPNQFAPAKKKPSADDLKPRYAVFVITPDNQTRALELGLAEEIDARIRSFRQALADPKSKNVGELGRAVDAAILRPVRDLLADATHLLISPDGQLNLIPFEALVDEKDDYLIEKHSISYLTSGRDLLRLQTARSSGSRPVLVANPAFGEPAGAALQTEARRSADSKRKSVTAARNLSETYFAPLIGTAQEARSIKALLPDAEVLSERVATETALKQVEAPRILHIATHGFFLEDMGKDFENPLLRSGLALAGANTRVSGKDDGILTALEASALNLWGTRLVVLSACDTGIGEVQNGEGVYGLRRAFLLAGTETLVMSLWSVSDYATRDLMTAYYLNLRAGMGRGEALRKVQLDMLQTKNRRHPFFWASFIQSGKWTRMR